jgi:signal transduction histidine kinase
VDTLTHDLKTPIIAIQGFSSRLCKKYGSKLDEKALDYLERIKTSADLLEAWMNDLRTLQQAGRIHYDMEEVSTIEIVEQLKAELQTEPGKSAAEIEVQQTLPVIHGNKTRIREVFQNLLTNAVKATRHVKNPRIEIGYEEKENFHQFHIRDNGVGIDPKDHKKIFERFGRIRGTKSSDGTGLGLAIVARIIEQQKGKVWVESEKGKGTTFYFTFPK